MAKLTYKLRETKGKGASIQLFFNYGAKKRLRYSTGLRIMNVKNWDEVKMRIKNVASELNRGEVNSKLDEAQASLNKKFINLKYNENIKIDNELLKGICDNIFNRAKQNDESQHLELFDFFEWYIVYYDKNPLPSGKPLGKGTQRTYKNAFTKIKQFDPKLTYDKVTIGFYEEFLEFLHEQDYSANYIGTIIGKLKTIMASAFERGYHQNMDYTKRHFAKPSERVYNIYLNEQELQKLHELDLSNAPTFATNHGLKLTAELQQRARDLFLIGANTGLRVSDYNRLTPQNLIERNGISYIKVTTRKNGKDIAIPINRMVKQILDRNDGKPPKKMPNQHINYALKKIGEKAGISKMETKEITKGGRKQTTETPKYDLICNHTARRSFCTNAYLSGMPTADIMAISGHSTEKIFYSYIKATHLERAEKIGKHSFFSE